MPISYRLFVAALLFLTTTTVLGKPKYGPEGHPHAVRIFDAHEYLRRKAAPDYWAMSPYYLPQQWGGSCSLASIAMVTNAARAHLKLSADDELASEKGILKRVKEPLVGGHTWASAVGAESGVPTGVTLDQLGALAKKTLESYGVSAKSIAVIHIEKSDVATRKALHQALVSNEKSDRDFILANFDQQKFTDDAQVGHVAPVAAYDEKTKQVLIFDPDREYYEPYWISEDTFFNAMNTRDVGAGKNRGYVHITLE